MGMVKGHHSLRVVLRFVQRTRAVGESGRCNNVLWVWFKGKGTWNMRGESQFGVETKQKWDSQVKELKEWGGGLFFAAKSLPLLLMAGRVYCVFSLSGSASGCCKGACWWRWPLNTEWVGIVGCRSSKGWLFCHCHSNCFGRWHGSNKVSCIAEGQGPAKWSVQAFLSAFEMRSIEFCVGCLEIL